MNGKMNGSAVCAVGSIESFFYDSFGEFYRLCLVKLDMFLILKVARLINEHK